MTGHEHAQENRSSSKGEVEQASAPVSTVRDEVTTETPLLRQIAQTRMWLMRLLRFSGRVITNFRKNKGLLLAGSVAYNTLLSLVPLFLVLMVGLSHFIEPEVMLQVVEAELAVIAPGQAEGLVDEIAASLDNRDWVGGLSLIVLLFFSSLSFRMLEDAMAIIFHKPRIDSTRGFWASAFLPYLFIGLFGVGLAVLTIMQSVLNSLEGSGISYWGVDWHSDAVRTVIVDAVALLGTAILLASIYKVLPATRIHYSRALVGGFVAALLWDITRRSLIWYFANLSLVNVVYGSLATVVIVLLSAEIFSVIVLLGAQVIAELEHAEAEERAWWEPPLGQVTGAAKQVG